MNVYNLYAHDGSHIDVAYVSQHPSDDDGSLFTAIIVERAVLTQLQQAAAAHPENIHGLNTWDSLLARAAYALLKEGKKWKAQQKRFNRQAEAATRAYVGSVQKNVAERLKE